MSKEPGIVKVDGKAYRRKSASVYAYMPGDLINFLERVTLEKRKGSVSKTLNMIVEGYRKLYARTTKEYLEMEGPKRGIESGDLHEIVIDIMKDLQKGVIS